MSGVKYKTVTYYNTSTINQYWYDKDGVCWEVLPGNNITLQVIDQFIDLGSVVPVDLRYISLKNQNGDTGYIYPNLTLSGVKVSPTEPPEI